MTIKEYILDAMGKFWTKLKSTYVTNCASTSNNLALAASQGKVLQDQITALNSRTMAYNYTGSTGSFLDWVSSTFTSNGNYYVVFASSNYTGWIGSLSGTCIVQKRNVDIYLYAFVNNSNESGNQEIYLNRYTNGAWKSWTKQPTRAEYDALNSKTTGSGTAENEYCTVDYTWTALAGKVCLVNMTCTPKTTINSSAGSVTLGNLPFLASRTVTGATYNSDNIAEIKGVCVLGSNSKNVTFLGPRTSGHSYNCGLVYL